MNADEFRETLKELGLTQTELRARLGLNKSTLSRYAKGHLSVPQYVVAYLDGQKKLRGAEIIC